MAQVINLGYRENPLERTFRDLDAKIFAANERQKDRRLRQKNIEEDRRERNAKQVYSSLLQAGTKSVPSNQMGQFVQTLTDYYRQMNTTDTRSNEEIINQDANMIMGKSPIGKNVKDTIIDNTGRKAEMKTKNIALRDSQQRKGAIELADVTGFMTGIPKDKKVGKLSDVQKARLGDTASSIKSAERVFNALGLTKDGVPLTAEDVAGMKVGEVLEKSSSWFGDDITLTADKLQAAQELTKARQSRQRMLGGLESQELTADVAEQFKRLAKGDLNKAREMAIKAGYTIPRVD
jgi:hypothetical protein